MRAIAHPSLLGLAPPADAAPIFHDRADAGERLGAQLASLRGRNVLVLGIPRGGVPVAAAVARALDAELDVVVARKLGAPESAELAIGAVTADGGRYLNHEVIDALDVPTAYVERATREQMAEAERRELRFRGGAPPPQVAGRTVLLVDDGLATGSTMIAAARALRARKPGRLIVAVPVGSREACALQSDEVDEVVCLYAPQPFWAVGVYYRDFEQTEDADVDELLREARGRRAHAPRGTP